MIPLIKFSLLSLTILVAGTVAVAGDWTGFRGGDAQSAAPAATPPTSFSEDENIAWSAPLPGRGFSSPIVVGDQVIVTSSSGFRHNHLHVSSFDRETGELQWHRQFLATGRSDTHAQMRVATPTPESDGESIFAFFSSNDLVCLDMEGRLKWYRGFSYDEPNVANSLGMSSSPILSGDLVIAQMQNDAESIAAAVNKSTGETVWQLSRPRKACWTSPVKLPGNTPAEDLVVLHGTKSVDIVRAISGETVWSIPVSPSSISSSTWEGNQLYVPANGVTAFTLPALGLEPQKVWNASRFSPATMSPVVYRDRLYVINRAGVLTCGDAASGDKGWQLRIGSDSWGTLIAAGDCLYIPGKDGKLRVVKLPADADGTPEIVCEHDLGESLYCCPAVAGDELFVRSDTTLWKIAAK
ncbi:outer membrane protein assembly factor BamB family protein [Calycomorphotria hydatis]|uniref:Outer membrane biogenesis protein BamB n=1 Tax=Calycomorphotria hydatis TaxID=2528027 RepID=A0A517T8W7_9PLAN|nr:PQQ-binding-like beta-propeller repeat protein [Calycomorphotria hydatis]QDT64820.1 outer membrane biogenesis protein BamB [Calycomorphotria hydatis]